MSTATVEQGRATAAPGAVLAAFAEDVFNRRDFSRLTEFMRTDYIQHNSLVPQGSAGFHEFFAAWFAASPDFKHDVKQLAVDGDRVWVYGTYSGTHVREWLGMPATGKSYRFDAVDIFRVENGKLAEHWDVLDIHTLFRQLGA